MSEHKPRPRALVAIVIYKCFTIGLLICVAIGLFLTSKAIGGDRRPDLCGG